MPHNAQLMLLRQIWSANTSSGVGFCRESPSDPEAFASPEGDMIVRIPIYDYTRRLERSAKTYIFKWNRNTYTLQK
jgi:hypothetical protein